MEKWSRFTLIFIILAVVAIAVYDLIAMNYGGKNASISFQLITLAYTYPALPFSIGFVCGHLFWRYPNMKGTEKLGKS